MRRAVITGFGIVSSIGNNKTEVLESLRTGKSGIVHAPDFAEHGLRSHVKGAVTLNPADHIDRKALRFMGDAAAYTYIAMDEAIDHAGLSKDSISDPRIGIVVGSGGSSTSNIVDAARICDEKGAKRVGPYMVPKTMASTVSANLATGFKIKGVNYSMSSACSTSAHCVGHAAELIQLGKQDIVFAGGGEELDWTMTVMFDAMGALSSKYNDNPSIASRAYDANRDGFVIAGGGGIVVVEDYDHAKARGATIYGEVLGYGANSDGADMVQPSGEGAVRCMNMALSTVPKGRNVTYINTHGTSTPVGDTKELGAIKDVFGDKTPAMSSTKSLTGHSLGATGVQEAIYSLLMMQHGFIAASAHIDELDSAAKQMDIVQMRRDDVTHDIMLSNSFGFGGTNACLVLGKVTE